MERIRWGILGTGSIAHQFARGLRVLADAELVAVGSRTQVSAEAFAKEFKIPHAHASYEDLVADESVDVVYIATPHPFHLPNTVLCLRAGKAVLCEKPLTMNKREAQEMVRVAVEEKRFLMEAMWTRFLPVVVRVRELLSAGVIGEPRMVQADFGFRTTIEEDHRLFDRSLGGGGLLDVGVYAVSFASMVFGGPPKEISSLAHLGETGVDEQAAMVLGYEKGELALLASGIATETAQEARIMGTEGMIHLPGPFWQGKTLVLEHPGKKAKTIHLPYKGNGYNCEAEEVMQCMRAGRLESSVMTHRESIEIMDTLDRIRAQWELRYPMDEKGGVENG